MKELRSIGNQMLLPSLIGITLLATILTGYFIYTSITKIERDFDESGNAIVRQLAPALAFPITINYVQDLRQLIAPLLDERDVIRAQILGLDNKLVLSVSRENGPTSLDPASDVGNIAEFSAGIFESIIHVDRFTTEIEQNEATPQTIHRGTLSISMDRSSLIRQRAELVGNVLLITFLSLVLTTFLMARLGQRVLRPILALTDTVENSSLATSQHAHHSRRSTNCAPFRRH